MTRTSISEHINLREVSIEDMEEKLLDSFSKQYRKTEVKMKTEHELLLNGYYKGKETEIHLERKSHRPLDVFIHINHVNDGSQGSKGYRPSRSGMVLFIFMFLPFFFYIIPILLFYMVNIFIFSINLVGIIQYTLIIFGIIILIYVLSNDNKSSNLNGRAGFNQRLHPKLLTCLNEVKEVLFQLKSKEIEVVKKCWNCFEEISLLENHCGKCGKFHR